MNIQALERIIDIEAQIKKKQLFLQYIKTHQIEVEFPNKVFIVNKTLEKNKKMNIRRAELELELLELELENIKYNNNILPI